MVLFSCPKLKNKQLVSNFYRLLFLYLERGGDHVKKQEFSKKLLIADYAILLLMIVSFFVLSLLNHDTSNCAIIIGAWVAQIAVSSGFYYWKAKSENLIKMPMALLNEMPKDMRERADPNAIIAAVLGIGTNN